jgi:hypothetical protein
VSATLSAEHFHPGPTRRAFVAVVQLADLGIDPGPPAVLGLLRRNAEAASWSNDQGCAPALAGWFGEAPALGQALWLVGILRDHLVRRRVQTMSVGSVKQPAPARSKHSST